VITYEVDELYSKGRSEEITWSMSLILLRRKDRTSGVM